MISAGGNGHLSPLRSVFENAVAIEVNPPKQRRSSAGRICRLDGDNRIRSHRSLKLERTQNAILIVTTSGRKEVIAQRSGTLLSRSIAVDTCPQEQSRLSLIDGVSWPVIRHRCLVILKARCCGWIRCVTHVGGQQQTGFKDINDSRGLKR